MIHVYRNAEECPRFYACIDNTEICRNCGSHRANHPQEGGFKVISLEGRIARIELTLANIFSELPQFIKESLGANVKLLIEEMKKDAKETIRLGRDTQ